MKRASKAGPTRTSSPRQAPSDAGAAHVYREHVPRAVLAELVECFWTTRLDDAPPVRVLPDGCADILIDRAAPGGPRAWLVGTMTAAMVAPGAARRDLLAVRFRPGGARALLGLPMPELVDGSATLDELALDANRWLDAIADAATPAAALAALEGALLERLPDVAPADRRAARAAQLCATPSIDGIAALADRLGLTRQHLRRLVKHATGVSPKQLARIGRARSVVEHIARGATPDAAMATAAGYFDQAHMVNDFKRLAGVTPRAYARERSGA